MAGYTFFFARSPDAPKTQIESFPDFFTLPLNIAASSSIALGASAATASTRRPFADRRPGIIFRAARVRDRIAAPRATGVAYARDAPRDAAAAAMAIDLEPSAFRRVAERGSVPDRACARAEVCAPSLRDPRAREISPARERERRGRRPNDLFGR
eukprot:31237-Pelagococcus_subviridis.AAC.17